VDPEGSATRVLRNVAEVNGASGAAIIAVRDSLPVLFASCNLPLEDVARLEDLWRDYGAWLQGKRTLEQPSTVLLPLLEGDAVLGVLYLKDPSRYDLATTSPWLAALSNFLRAASQGGAIRGVYPENPPSQRDQLLRALNEREWNVARVARDLGVTRRTIYLRMGRFDIARQHIPKSLRAKRAV
jgi:transcriptional regulator with GAF, ATPase, and Fis domain